MAKRPEPRSGLRSRETQAGVAVVPASQKIAQLLLSTRSPLSIGQAASRRHRWPRACLSAARTVLRARETIAVATTTAQLAMRPMLAHNRGRLAKHGRRNLTRTIRRVLDGERGPLAPGGGSP